MRHPFDTVSILGTPLVCADYNTAVRFLLDSSQITPPLTVTASASHLVTAARHNPSFRKILHAIDVIFPDGMPLIRLMNWQNAKLKDRVYGPYLMRYVIRAAPAPHRHFFFGGTQECLDQLIPALQRLQPNLLVAGILSPPFRPWTEQDQIGFSETIRKSTPDFIWVALGGERQEQWIVENRHRFERGVMIGIGDAFELIAGRRSFAPNWMQRLSLTWLYRLIQEPRRLWKRYLLFNFLFLWYLAWDAILLNRKKP